MAKGKGAAGGGSIRKKTVTRNGKEYTYWEARVTVGRDPGTGRQKQKSITGKTQKEVREKLQAMTVEVNNGSYQEPAKMSLAAWLDIWLEDYMGDKKYATIKHYKAQVATHIKPRLGAIPLAALAPHDIQRFYNQLQKDGQEKRRRGPDGKVTVEHVPLSAKSVRNVHGILTKALTVAVDMGYLRDNPAERVTLPRVVRQEIRPLTDAQIADFLREVSHDEFSAYFKTVLFCGLRESEAIGLTWDCIDFDAGRITIKKQLQKRPKADGGFVFAPLKNDKVRVIAPAPFILRMLEEQKRQQALDRLRAGDAWVGWLSPADQETYFVFTNGFGQHLHPQTVYNHLKKIAASIGAPDCRVHDLRHTFAVLSLQNGDDIKTVQSNLGHATAAFTLDVYGHVSERMKDDSAARMENYISSISG